MTRKLGEKSYNPGVFRLDFWGDSCHYQNLFDRKLPGAIVLAAYDVPMTVPALSAELGVSTVYLEDELDILEAAGILKKSGDRYQTNLVIITDAYEKEFVRNTVSVYDSLQTSFLQKQRKSFLKSALWILPEIVMMTTVCS